MVEHAALILFAQSKKGKKNQCKSVDCSPTASSKVQSLTYTVVKEKKPIFDAPQEECPPPYVPPPLPVILPTAPPAPQRDQLVPAPYPDLAQAEAPVRAQAETPAQVLTMSPVIKRLLSSEKEEEEEEDEDGEEEGGEGLDRQVPASAPEAKIRKSARLASKDSTPIAARLGINPVKSQTAPASGAQKPKPIQVSDTAKLMPIGVTPAVVPEVKDGGQVTYSMVNTYSYVPFNTSDLLNWKNHGPFYEDDLEQFIKMIEGVMTAHNPTWSDIQQLGGYVLTSEQRMQIQANLEEAALKRA